MSYTVGVILACVAMAIVTGMVQQAWTYFRGQQIISRRQFALRLTTGSLLLVCIGLIFVLGLQQFSDLRVALLIYMALTLLPVVVLLLAWLDLRELRRIQHLRQAQLYRDLADIQEEIKRQQAQRE